MVILRQCPTCNGEGAVVKFRRVRQEIGPPEEVPDVVPCEACRGTGRMSETVAGKEDNRSHRPNTNPSSDGAYNRD